MPVPIVVAAAIVTGRPGDRRVLAAQRAEPPELAGSWGLPRGKVEPGESEVVALVRECRAELGVEVEPLHRLGADLVTAGGAALHVWLAWLPRGEPRALEHRALRWLGAAELHAVDWLAADVLLLPELAAALRG